VTSESGWTSLAGANPSEAVEGNMMERHWQKKLWWLALRREDLCRDMLELDWEMPVETCRPSGYTLIGS
jgi:hypothetical protein